MNNPGIEVKVTFTRNIERKIIDSYDSSKEYKIEIDDVKLHMPIGDLAPSVFENFMKHLPKEVAVLAFKRLVVTILKYDSYVTSTCFWDFGGGAADAFFNWL